jgi:hypothetical protein
MSLAIFDVAMPGHRGPPPGTTESIAYGAQPLNLMDSTYYSALLAKQQVTVTKVWKSLAGRRNGRGVSEPQAILWLTTRPSFVPWFFPLISSSHSSGTGVFSRATQRERLLTTK